MVNNNYTIYSGSFASASALGTATLATNSVATTNEENKLVVKCNHSYVDGVCEYCGAKLISMSKGAAMRYNDPTGMRFYTTVDQDEVKKLIDSGATVEMGTLVAPKDLVDGELVFANEADIYAENANYVVVPFEMKDSTDTYFDYYTDGAFSGIVGSIVNISESNAYNATSGNIKRDFIGRGYIKVVKEGVTTVTYADYAGSDVLNNTRSIGFIADSVQNGSEYAGLDASQKEIVDKYATIYNA